MLQLLPDIFAAPVSQGDMSNPLTLVVDSSAAAVTTNRLYLYNNDPTVYYSDVRLTVLNIPTDWSIKLSNQTQPLTEAEWAAIASGNTITWDTIGDPANADTNYQAFWLRWEVPMGLAPTTNIAVKLYVQYVEHSI